MRYGAHLRRRRQVRDQLRHLHEPRHLRLERLALALKERLVRLQLLGERLEPLALCIEPDLVVLLRGDCPRQLLLTCGDRRLSLGERRLSLGERPLLAGERLLSGLQHLPLCLQHAPLRGDQTISLLTHGHLL